jgi:hypothetical protein
MRHSLLLPVAVLGLAGCVGAGVPSAQRASASYVPPSRSATFLTPEQSAAYIMMPGDSITTAQTNVNPMPYENSSQPDADSPRPAGLLSQP